MSKWKDSSEKLWKLNSSDERKKLQKEIVQLQQENKVLHNRAQGVHILAKVLQDSQESNARLQQEVQQLKFHLAEEGVDSALFNLSLCTSINDDSQSATGEQSNRYHLSTLRSTDNHDYVNVRMTTVPEPQSLSAGFPSLLPGDFHIKDILTKENPSGFPPLHRSYFVGAPPADLSRENCGSLQIVRAFSIPEKGEHCLDYVRGDSKYQFTNYDPVACSLKYPLEHAHEQSRGARPKTDPKTLSEQLGRVGDGGSYPFPGSRPNDSGRSSNQSSYFGYPIQGLYQTTEDTFHGLTFLPCPHQMHHECALRMIQEGLPCPHYLVPLFKTPPL